MAMVSVIVLVIDYHTVCMCVCVVQLYTIEQKYNKIPEVEQLRREIGSYQLK